MTPRLGETTGNAQTRGGERQRGSSTGDTWRSQGVQGNMGGVYACWGPMVTCTTARGNRHDGGLEGTNGKPKRLREITGNPID